MDKVRFGRALGYGARHTAKALYKAVDAARAPAAPGTRPPTADGPALSRPAIQRPAAPAARPSPTAIAGSARALGRSVWSPLARFSGVLWLQVTGSVYAVIALAMGQAVWTRRADLKLSIHSPEAQHVYLLLVIFLLFAYFAVSAFVRAARREKR